MITCVVFDMGQVLASPPELFTLPADRLGVEPEALELQYWVGRRAYDEGGSDASYWGPLLEALGRRPSPELIHELATQDANLWIQLRPDAWRLLKEVRATGTTVAVLSNAPFVIDMALLDAPWVTDVDHVFVSASMGMTKPNPTVYARVQEVVDVPADQIAFIDDRQPNVDGAERAGWHTHLFVDDADTRAWLAQLGVLS